MGFRRGRFPGRIRCAAGGSRGGERCGNDSSEGFSRGVATEDYLAIVRLSADTNSWVADPQARIQALAERYGDDRVEWIDGVSVSYEDWHFNGRPSNTEPLLRLNLEGMSRELMEEKQDELLAFIRA